MPYEVRITGRQPVRFNAQPEAVEYALAHADENPEVLDTETGEPAAPGATEADRDELARKIGF